MKIIKTKIKKNISKITTTLLVMVVSLVFGLNGVYADVTKEISYQGKLTNGSGIVVSDGSYDMKISLYDASSGGNCVWTARGTCSVPTAKAVSVSSGVFNTMLGESGDNALNLDFSSSYWLGITIGSDAEMTPRKKLGSTPYAFTSLNLIGNGYIDVDNTSTAQDAMNVNYDPTSGTFSASNIVYGSGGGTGTALRVQQSGTGKILELFDNNTSVMSVLDGGNVGIGTTAPMVVNGNTAAGTGLNVYSASTATSIVDSSGGSQLLFNDRSQSANSRLWRMYETGSDLQFASMNDALTVKNQVLSLTNGGNVGIGTTAPGARLSIKDTNTFNITPAQTAAGEIPAGILINGDTNSTYTPSSAGTAGSKIELAYYNGSNWFSAVEVANVSSNYSNLILMKSGGNVGIGTTAPGSLINTGAYFKPDASGENVDINSSSHEAVLNLISGQAANNSHVGGVYFTRSAGASDAHRQIAAIQARQVMLGVDDVSGGSLYFFTKPYGDGLGIDSPRMVIAPNGYVGIGTTAPGAALEVNGQVKITGGTPGAGKVLTSDANGLATWTSSSGLPSVGNADTTDNYHISGNANYITKFNSSNNTLVNSLMYDDGTNVGIGTTNPTASLSVNGSIEMKVNASATRYVITDGTNTATGKVVMQAGGGSAGYGGAINLYAHANVTHPGDVVAAISSGSGGAFRVNSSGLDGGTDWFYVGGVNGNVGIGTTAPGYKLQINGSEYIVGGLGSNNSGAYSSANRLIFDNDYNDTPRGPNKITLYDSSWLGGFGVQNGAVTYYSGGDHIFYQATSTSNASEKFRITSAGNVGIGASAPGQKLGVAGNIELSTGGYIYGDTTNPSLLLNNASGSKLSYGSGVYFEALAASINIKATSEPIAIWNNNGNIRLAADGNVGIGTTSPGAKLDVYGGIFRVSTSGANYAGIEGNAAGSYFYNTSTGPAFFGNSEGYQTLTADGGNVGIGKTNPGYLTDIYSASNTNLFRINYAGTDVMTVTNAQTTFNNPVTMASAGDVSMAYDLNFTNQTSSTIRSNASLTLESGELFESNDLTLRTFNSGSLVLDTPGGMVLSQSQNWTLASAVNALNIQNSGASSIMSFDTTNSRVGIGITNPFAKLVVNDTSVTSGYHDEFGITNNGNGMVVAGYNANGAGYTSGYVTSRNNIPLFLGVGYTFDGTQGITILNGGNVGIGTTNPQAKMHVGTAPELASDISTVGLFGTSVSGAAYPLTLANTASVAVGNKSLMTFDFGTGWSATGYVGAAIENTSTAGTALVFGNYSSDGMQERMRIQNGGNVGIGTTNPARKLSVYDVSAAQGLFYGYSVIGGAADSRGSIRLGNTDAYHGRLDYDAGGATTFYMDNTYDNASAAMMFRMRTAGTAVNAMTILGSGNVGIGTTAPGAALEVNGQVKITGGTPGAGKVLTSDANGLATWTSSSGLPSVGNADTTDNYHVSGNANYVTKFNSSNNTLVNSVMYDDGTNVGIGTVSPYEKLEVSGAISATGDVVANSSQGPAVSMYYAGGVGKIQAVDWGVEYKNLSLNANGGYVGIGTTAPGAKLEVGGSRPIKIDTGGGGVRIQGDTGGWGTGLYFVGSSGTDRGGFGALGGADSLSYYWIGAAYNNATMYVTPSNVGIGTTAPGARLEVKGNGIGKVLIGDIGGYADYAGISLNGSAAAGYYNLLSRASDGTLLINRPTGGDIAFYENNGTNQMVIRATSGFVGIGAATPSYNLQVDQGGATLKGPTLQLKSTYAAGGTHATMKFTVDNASSENDTFQLSNSDAGDFTMGEGNGSGGFNARLWFRRATDGGHIVLQPYGNVGVGISNPTHKLEVYGSTSWDDSMKVTSTSSSVGTEYYSSTSTRTGVVYGAGANFGLLSGDTGWVLRISDSDAEMYHPFSMSNTMTFTQGSSTRNYGTVGTYDPTRLAAIWAMGSGYEIAANGTSGGSLYGLSYSYEPDYSGSGNNPGAISGLGHQMQWRAAGATQTAIGTGIWTIGDITSNGNQLFNGTVVEGDSKTMLRYSDSYLRFNEDVDFTSGIWMGSSNFMGSSGIFAMGSNGGTTNSKVYIYGGGYTGANYITINGETSSSTSYFNTNFAVGATSVSNGKMYVYNSGGSDIISVQSGVGNGYIVFADAGTPTWANAPRIGANTNDLVFRNSNAETMRLTSGGLVGIGISNPLTKFQVAGGAYAMNLGGANMIPYASDMSVYNSNVTQRTFIDGSSVSALDSPQNGSGGCYQWGSTGYIPADPNQDYEYSIWAESNGVQNIYIGFFVYDSSGAQITSGLLGNPYFHSSTENTNGSWEKITAFLRASTTPKTADYIASTTSSKSGPNVSDWVMPSNTAYIMMRWGSCYGGTGTSGRVYLYNPSIKAVAQDEYYGSIWSKFNGSGYNVGIGTSAPGAALEVNGQVKITGGTPGAGKILTSDANGLATWTASSGLPSVGNADTTDNYHISGNANYVTKFNSSNNTLVNSLMYDNGTNVGIGVTNPDATLQVKNSTDGATVLKLDSSSSVKFSYRINAASDDYLTLFRDYSGGNLDLMTWRYSGNVGIGTISPNYKLDVNGDVNASSYIRAGGYAMNAVPTSYGTYGLASAKNGYYGILFGQSTGNANIMYDGSGNGGIYYENYGWSTYYLASNRHYMFNTATDLGGMVNIAGGDSSTPGLKVDAPVYPMIDFYSDNANGNNRNWRIAGVYNSYGKLEILSSTSANTAPTTNRFTIDGTNGYVGINTTNPGYFLDVNGTANMTQLRLANGFTLNQGSSTYASLGSWIDVGSIGLFSSTVNSAHWYPNSTSGYGSWSIAGTRSGYSGINYNGNTTLMMNDSTLGFYNDSEDEWMMYANRNSGTYLYYDGSLRLQTSSSGVDVITSDSTSVNLAIRAYNPNAGNGSGARILIGPYSDSYMSSISSKGYPNSTYASDLWLQPRLSNATLGNGIYITNTDLVGIGTTDPARKFQVNGTMYANGGASETPSSSADFIGTSGYWGFRTGTDYRFALDTYNLSNAYQESLTVLRSGNIGIGTASPAQKLEVNGNTKIGDNLLIGGNSSYKVYYNLASLDNYGGSAGALVIDTNIPFTGTNMFTVTIQGYNYDNASPWEMTVSGYAGEGSFHQRGYTSINTAGLGVPYFARQASTGKVAIILGYASPSSTYGYQVSVVRFTQGFSGISESYADGWTITPRTSLAAYDYILACDDKSVLTGLVQSTRSGTNYITGGNFGIGTVDPDQKLEVYTSSSASYTARFNAGGYYTDFYNNVDWSELVTNSSKFYVNKEWQVDTGLIGSYDENLSLRTSGTTRVTIQNTDGNVGIGTTAPDQKLYVNGNMTVNGTIYGNQAASMISVSSGGDAWYGMGQSTAGGGATPWNGYYPYAISMHTGLAFSAHSSYGGIRFYNQNYPTGPMKATADMTIINTNVGIGTENPGTKMHIVGSNFMLKMENTDGTTANQYAQFGLFAGSTNNYIWSNNQNSTGFYGGSGALNIYTGQASPIAFFTNATSTPQMVVASGGNVGIGTTVPGAKLDVNGTISQGPTVAHPAATWGASGSTTGAVVISLPGTSGNYGMLHVEITTYEYDSNSATTYIVGGHNWAGQWYNYSCRVVGTSAKKCRVGYKDGHYVIVLGQQGDTWSYGQVAVSRIQTGSYYSGVMDLGGTYTVAPDNGADGTYTWITGDIANRTGFASGTSNYIAKFSGANSLGNSVMYDDGTSVAVGTASTPYKFTVNGDIGTYGANQIYARYNNSENYKSSLNWYGLQLGNNGSNYIIGGRTATGGTLNFIVNNTSDFTSVNGSTAVVMNADASTTFYGPIKRSAAGKGYLDGGYASIESTNSSGAIYSIGGSYVPGTTTLGNMYGIGYGYSGGGGITFAGLPNDMWGMYVASGGTPSIFLESGNGRIWTAAGGNILSGGHIEQKAGYYIYPGSSSGTDYQTSYYLYSNSTWGLQTNTSLNANGLYDYGNRVCSASNSPCSISITGSAGSATYATYVVSPDGDRNPNTKLPTTTPQAVRFDFSSASYTGTGGNYAGVMTYAPWTGTSASTGDASYQLVFGSTAINGNGLAQMRIRNGIDSTWNDWQNVVLSDRNGSVGIGTTGPIAKLDVRYPSYAAANYPLFVGNSGYSYTHVVYDTAVIQQDDVTTLRMVEYNNGGTNQEMGYSVGDGYGNITSTVPLRFFGGSTPGSTPYSGAGGNLALTIATNGVVNFASTPTIAGNTIWHEGNDGSGSGLDADTLDTLHLNSTTTNNEANKIVRTDANGYANFGWINTVSGDSGIGNDISRVYTSYDGYIRYLNKTDFKTLLGLSGKSSYDRRDSTTDADYWVGSTGWSGWDMNTLFDYGSNFIDVWSGSNFPSGTSHVHGFQALHYTNSTNRYGMQVVAQYNQPTNLWFRTVNNTTFNSWYKLWNDGNDGAGSGLDADNIDGFAFTNSGAGAAISGADSLTNNGIGYVNSVSLFGQTDGALYAQAYDSNWVGQIFQDYRTGQIAIRGKNSGTWQNWRTVMDSSNFGATSFVTTGGTVVTGNAITNSGTGGWTSQAYSKDGFVGGAYASAVVDNLGHSSMFGLNTDPAADASYCSIDYAWYVTSSTNGYIYESCSNVATGITIAAGDVLAVSYDGVNVKYLRNGEVVRTVAVAITSPLYFDSSFANTGYTSTFSHMQIGGMSPDNYVNITGDTMTGNLQLSSGGKVYLNGGTSYGIGVGSANSAVFDTLDSVGSDTLELNYVSGSDVQIGPGSGTHNLHVPSGGLSVGYGNDPVAGNGIFSNSIGIGTSAPAYREQIFAGHGDTQLELHSTGGGTAATEADLILWASEPGQTYSGTGIANNMYNTTSFPRINTARGGSMMRLLDNSISWTTVNSSGTQVNGMTLDGSGNLSVYNDLYVSGTVIEGDSKTIVRYSDAYLRLNEDNDFGSGIWMGPSHLLTSSGYWGIGSNGGTTTSSTYLVGAYTGTNLIKIDSSSASATSYFNAGNVGIGTTAPVARLEVAGSIYFSSGASRTIKVSTPGSGSGNSLQIAAADGGSGVSTDGGTLYLDGGSGNNGSSGNVIISYNNSAHVGIGTPTPANKLDVEGSMAIGESYSGTSSAPSNGLIVQGSVGIGTTAPAVKLDVNGSASADYIRLKTDYEGSAPTCSSSTVGAIVREKHAAANYQRIWHCSQEPNASTYTWVVLANSATTGNPDIAEYAPTADSSIEGGDIVSVSNEIVNSNNFYNKFSIEKAKTSNKKSMIGVISTNPGTILNEGYSQPGMPADNSNNRPLALAGRVPVKIITDKNISKGDLITVSDVPGYGTVNYQSDSTVGKALTGFDTNQSCISKNSVNDIDWKNEPTDSCYKLSDGRYAMKLLVFVDPQYDPQRGYLTEKTNSLESQMEAYQAQLDSVTNSQNLLAAEIANISDSISLINNQLSQMDSKFSTVDSQVSNLNLNLDEKYSILTGQINTLKERIENDPYQMQISGLESKVNELEQKLASLSSETSEPVTTTSEETREIVFLNTNVTNIDTNTTNISTTLSNAALDSGSYGGDYVVPDAYNEIRIVTDGANIYSTTLVSEYLSLPIYLEDAASVTDIAIEIGNQMDTNEIQWSKDKLPALTNGWNTLNLDLKQGTKTGDIDWTRINYFRIYFKSSAVNKLKIGNINIELTENVTRIVEGSNGQLTIDNSQLTNLESDVKSQMLIVSALQNQMADIKAQTEANTSLLLSMDPQNMVYKDALGNVDLMKGKLEADGVTAGAFTVKVIDNEAATIGKATMLKADVATGADGKSVIVKTKSVTANSRIFVTPKTTLSEPLAVTEIVPGTSFKVEIKTPVDKDVEFDWWIVESK